MKARCLKLFSFLFALMLTVMIIPATEVQAQVSAKQPILGYVNPYSWEKTVETEITETRTIELSGTRVRDLDKLVSADFKVIQPYGGYGYYRLYKNGEFYKEFTYEDLYEGDIEIEAGVTYTIYAGKFISPTKIVFTEEPVAVQYDVTYSVHVQDKIGTYYVDGVYHVNGEGFTFGILVPQGYYYRDVWTDDMLTSVVTRNWGKDYDQDGYHYESYTVTGSAYKDIQITYEYYSTTGPTDLYDTYVSVENDDSDYSVNDLLALVPDEGRGGDDCACPSYEKIEEKYGSELAKYIYNVMRSGKYPEICNCENCQCDHSEKDEVIVEDDEDIDETIAEETVENEAAEEVPAETTEASENVTSETPAETTVENTVTEKE